MSDPNLSPPPPPPPPWYDGLSDELKGHAQNRGLHAKPADEAARQLLQDHREAQQKLGLPPERVIRLPADAADPAWNDVYQRLGAPKSPDDYKFEGIKFKDGTELPADFTSSIRATAAELHLPVDAAQKLAQRLVAFVDADEERTKTATAAEIGAAQVALRQSWGRDYDLNMFKTTKVIEALGWDAATIDALQNAAGTGKFLNGLLAMANRMGEAELLRGGSGPAQNTALTREQALERKATMLADQSKRKLTEAEQTTMLAELMNLDRIIVGAPAR